MREIGAAAPVSVALGDLPNLPHTAALAARGASLSGADYVKVGLREVRELEAAVAIMRAVADAVATNNGGDRRRLCGRRCARSTGSRSHVAARTGGSGPESRARSIDTFVKDGRGLYGWLSDSELSDLIARTRRAGASFAVAGQLTLNQLRRAPADVVGVRSAVCHGGDRAADARRRAGGGRGRRGPRRQRAGWSQRGMIRVPTGRMEPGLRTTTATPVRRTASGR